MPFTAKLLYEILLKRWPTKVQQAKVDNGYRIILTGAFPMDELMGNPIMIELPFVDGKRK